MVELHLHAQREQESTLSVVREPISHNKQKCRSIDMHLPVEYHVQN